MIIHCKLALVSEREFLFSVFSSRVLCLSHTELRSLVSGHFNEAFDSDTQTPQQHTSSTGLPAEYSTQSAITCDPMSDIGRHKQEECGEITARNSSVVSSGSTGDYTGYSTGFQNNSLVPPRESFQMIKDSQNRRNGPRLERQARVRSGDVSPLESEKEFCIVHGETKGQSVERWPQESEEKEDDYVPLWTVGRKISTTVQYKSDDTYVPIWTSNVPKPSREYRNSKSVDDALTGDLHFDPDIQVQSQRSPGAQMSPKAYSVDMIARNKTTNVIVRENLNLPPRKVSQPTVSSQGHIQDRGQTYSNNDAAARNFNGHLKKLKLGAATAQVPGRPADAAGPSHDSSRLQVPSLLERRGFMLQEASSEERPLPPAPPLPAKQRKPCLRSYSLLGRSMSNK